MRRSRREIRIDSDRPLWEFADDASTAGQTGIALSGGGVRSAAFSLGALQAMQQHGWLRRAAFISAVSGGSYVAAAYVASTQYSDEGAVRPPFAPLWADGSPEQTYLARHLGYLARGVVGRFWFFANFMFGAVMNLLPLLCGSFVAGRLLGLLYRSTHDGFAERQLDGGELFAYFTAALLPLMLGVIVVGIHRLNLGRGRLGMDSERGMRLSAILGLVSIGLVLLLTVVPVAAILLNRVLERFGAFDEDHTGLDWVVARFLSGVAVVAAGLLLAVGALLCLRRPILRRVAVLLSTVAGVAILLTPCLLAVGSTAVRGWSTRRDLIALGLATVVLLLFGFVIHNRLYSMHNFYRERLSEAFFVERKDDPPLDKSRPWVTATRMIPYAERVRLSQCPRQQSGARTRPELLIGAAVNATDLSVSFGSGAAPFVFSPSWCGSHQLGWSRTERLDALRSDGGADLTLPAMVAISGAALSPVMGRFTVSSFRFLLALLNVRLGVWIPRPLLDDAPETRSRIDNLPAIVRKPIAAAIAGRREPGAFYVLREGLGRTSMQGRFVYVTDGGHWENLGLYELVRRRCSLVVAFDASNNPKDGLADLSRCCHLLFTRLGVEIEFDDDGWATLAAEAQGSRPLAAATIRYPDGATGRLVYCRCQLWPDAPPELARYAKLDGRFPKHSTSNQFLNGDQFEAYRRLGWCIGGLANELLAREVRTQPVGEEPKPVDDEPKPSANEHRRPRLVSVS